MELPHGWGLGAQLRFDLFRNADDDGNTFDFSQTVVLSHDIVGSLAGFVEFLSVVPTESDSDWFGTLNFGLTYGVNENVQVDGGAFLGVNSAAPDLAVFMGITWRF